MANANKNEKKEMSEEEEKQERILKEIGISGFPFQKVIEKLLLSNDSDYYPHQVEVPLGVPPEYTSSKFVPPSLDFALCYAERSNRYPPKWSIDLLVECKKAYEMDLYFFSKQTGSYYMSDRFPISAAINSHDIATGTGPFSKSIFYDCNTPESPIKPPVCDNVLEFKNRGKRNDRDAIYEACGTLSVALIHFLNASIASMDHLYRTGGQPDDVTLVFPLLVTNANLHIIDSNELSVDINTGVLDMGSIKQSPVDWVLFEFPLSSSLQMKEIPIYQLSDSQKELASKMGCIIVQANSLYKFLSTFSPWFLRNSIVNKFLE